MAVRQKPRLGLFARLGFIGAFGVAAIAGAATYDWRSMVGAQSAQAQIADASSTLPAPVTQPAPKRTLDPETATIDDLLAADVGETRPDIETTGSVAPAPAPKIDKGPVTGLPIPRFVSIKADKVNVRKGPSRDHDIAWIFQRAGLPVEITAEFENWRRIRDSDGAEGWVMQSMLSGRRTALVAPWSKDRMLPVRRTSDDVAPVVAQLEPGVLGAIEACSGEWCRLDGDGFDGWIRQSDLWGAYPGELVE